MTFVLYQIEDLATLCEAREEDLREAGLKMGDIIRIRKMLKTHETRSLDSSMSSISVLSEEEEQCSVGENQDSSLSLSTPQVRNLPCK